MKRKNKTKIFEDYLELAGLANLELVNMKFPKNSTIKTNWKCPSGHDIFMSYNGVTRKVRLNRKCQQCKNLTKDDYTKMGLNSNFYWKGAILPKNSHCLTEWECERGHIWQSQYANIQQGKGCPYCRNKNEEECRSIFESIFKEKFPKKKPKWLKVLENVRNLELDGFNENLGIAFEYDGGQHFYSVKWWGGEEYLKEIKERDLLKNKICKEKGITLIRIPYSVQNKKKHIISQLKLNNKLEGLKYE